MCERHDPAGVHPLLSPAKAIDAALASVAGARMVPNRLAIGREPSARRKLWDLPAPAHCPLIGVCLPMDALRRLIGKVVAGQVLGDDYELHVGAVSEAHTRNRLSEALQRELERRYAIVIKRHALAKTTAALALLWQEAVREGDVAGALWAVLTHPRCDEDLRERVLRDIHMIQHQAGAGTRADLARLQACERELTQARTELAQQAARHERELALLRTNLAEREAELARAATRQAALEADCARARMQAAALAADARAKPRGAPHAAANSATADSATNATALRTATRETRQWMRRALRAEARLAACGVKSAVAPTEHASPSSAAARLLQREHDAHRTQGTHEEKAHCDQAHAMAVEHAAAPLRDKAVLCVGGRAASVPFYRRIVEHTGGRFLHHDGGAEHTPAQLEASLGAADLVICQAGCVSHGAYWRVKDHCKRTGKRCVFLDKPSASGLMRCLRDIHPVHAGEPAQ